MRTFSNNFSDLLLNFVTNVARPFLFSDEFGNINTGLISYLTPGSDYNYFADRDNIVVWGRGGNDSLVGFDPAAQPGQQQIDVLTGDFVDEEFYELFGLVGEDLERIPRGWNDRFILGDWKQFYYIDNPPFDFLGLNQFAVIADFSPSQNLIGLHGTPQDYHLLDSPLGTAIFWQQETVSDLVALLPGVSGLSLDGPSFRFQGDTPPPGPVLEEAQQIGTEGIDFVFGAIADPEGNVYLERLSRRRDDWLFRRTQAR